jgi:hypothetical protein
VVFYILRIQKFHSCSQKYDVSIRYDLGPLKYDASIRYDLDPLKYEYTSKYGLSALLDRP